MGAIRDCIWQKIWQQCKSHFRSSHLRIFGRIARMKRCQSQERIGKDFLPIRSWEDLPHPCNPSGFMVSRFPGLPKLLPSAAHLVGLHLRDIPQSGYFSPEAMPVLIALSTLTNIRDLSLCFSPPRSCPDRTSLRLPLLAWSDLPFLTSLTFKGVIEYLDDLVACIDAPQLSKLTIMFSIKVYLTCHDSSNSSDTLQH